jgi:pyrroloquinoline quinone (PQQ) biosynthesis protein C
VFAGWKSRLFLHPLWTGLAAGTLPAQTFFGWLLETYHFIEGVNVRLSYAAAHCVDVRLRRIFAHHYAEEWDHAAFFLQALEAYGLTAEQVHATKPHPATSAVLHEMRWCARTDPLAYGVCSGFLESTGEDRAVGREFLARLGRAYSPPDAPNVTAPLAEHIALDERYQHNGLLEDLCRHVGEIGRSRASAALDAGYRLVETLELWSGAVLATYGTGLDRRLPSPSRSLAELVDTDGRLEEVAPVDAHRGYLLGRHVTVAERDDGIRFEDADEMVEVGAARKAAVALRRLARGTTAAALARDGGFTAADAEQVLRTLVDARMVLDLDAEQRATTVEGYLDAFFANAEVRAREALATRLWDDALNGRSTDDILVGWGIEFYHFVEASNEYMCMGVASSSLDTVGRRWMADHCAEETDHGRIFLAGLTKLGFDEADLVDAAPLPTTRGLVNLLFELAASDTLSYLATFAVMQQHRTPRPVADLHRFLDFLATTYPGAAPVVEAFRRHAAIDVDLDHGSLVFERVIERLGLPSPAQRLRIADAVDRVATAFWMFYEGVVDFYGEPTSLVPRRRMSASSIR